jgi:hypothetical protein
MAAANALTLDLAPLRSRFTGDVVAPGDAAYDEARLAWNLAVDQRPAVVAIPESAADVVAAVAFARDAGLRLAPQGTGHNAFPLGDLSGAMLLKMHKLDKFEVDAESRRARAEAGVVWEPVVNAASEHGLAPLAGSSPDVGIVGYTLGGGIGWLARKHGLASSSVLAIEVVLADGRIVRTDSDHEPELFHALRGGGGNFGVVTAIEFALYEVPELYAGMALYPIERAAEILQLYRQWAETVPDEVTSAARLLQFPPIEEVPEPVRGQSFVGVEVAYEGGATVGAGLVAPFLERRPAMATFAEIPPAALLGLHMDPPHPVPGAGHHTMLGELTADTVDTLVEIAGAGSGSPLLSVELRQLGGAIGRPDPYGGAIDSIDGAYAVFAVGMAPTPEAVAAIKRYAETVCDALSPWDAGNRYLNFAEAPTDARAIFGRSYDRVAAAKAKYDPSDLFRANHPVTGAG